MGRLIAKKGRSLLDRYTDALDCDADDRSLHLTNPSYPSEAGPETVDRIKREETDNSAVLYHPYWMRDSIKSEPLELSVPAESLSGVAPQELPSACESPSDQGISQVLALIPRVAQYGSHKRIKEEEEPRGGRIPWYLLRNSNNHAQM
jgi:hypothetical protein